MSEGGPFKHMSVEEQARLSNMSFWQIQQQEEESQAAEFEQEEEEEEAAEIEQDDREEDPKATNASASGGERMTPLMVATRQLRSGRSHTSNGRNQPSQGRIGHHKRSAT